MKKSNSRPAKGRPALPADERKSIVVAVKFDIDSYQQMMDKALTAGLNRSEYIRQVSVKGRVVERLSPRDIKAIRDLQGIAANINQIAKFVNAIFKGNGNNEMIFRTYQDIVRNKEFVQSLIKKCRNETDNV